jgi:hypothetical protein
MTPSVSDKWGKRVKQVRGGDDQARLAGIVTAAALPERPIASAFLLYSLMYALRFVRLLWTDCSSHLIYDLPLRILTCCLETLLL